MSTTDAAPSGELLEARAVSKAFAGVQALSNVSLDVRPGEVHALLGENGAGKSTLVKVISGVLRPDEGDVLFRGAPFRPGDPDESSRRGVGVVFQELPLIPDLTVMENIFFNRQPMTPLGTVARRRMRHRTGDLFAALGLTGIAPERIVRELSVAARQFVAIAKVLADDPAVVILDEATSALGPSEVEWLLAQTSRLAAQGKGIVFISHRLAEVQEVADRVTVLRNGANAGTWDRGAVEPDQLIAAMLGRRLDQLYPPRARPARAPVLLGARQLASGRRLRDATFDLHEGEILGIAGLEGQGQLELFLALYGMRRSHGEITVAGRPRRIRSPRDALHAGIGLALVPEDRKSEGILPTLSVRENLSLPVLSTLTRHGLLRRPAERSAVETVIGDLKIGRGDSEQVVSSLSGGNQQKVVVGKFLLTGARLLLLYDLTRGVDVGTKAEIFRMTHSLADQGYGILFYSSDLSELINVPHRVAVMFDGTLTEEFAQDDLDQEKLIAAMVGHAPRAPLAPSPAELGDATGEAGREGTQE
jgi:ribose transport system ATP-binding protein